MNVAAVSVKTKEDGTMEVRIVPEATVRCKVKVDDPLVSFAEYKEICNDLMAVLCSLLRGHAPLGTKRWDVVQPVMEKYLTKDREHVMNPAFKKKFPERVAELEREML